MLFLIICPLTPLDRTLYSLPIFLISDFSSFLHFSPISFISSLFDSLPLLLGVASYRRLTLAGDIKAAQKLAAITGEGDLASKGFYI